MSTTIRIIPRHQWLTVTTEELQAQPGHKVELKLSETTYHDAYEWAVEQYNHDLHCATWQSLSWCGTFIFARAEQAMMFKLTWAGR